jgi:hypothetical protein
MNALTTSYTTTANAIYTTQAWEKATACYTIRAIDKREHKAESAEELLYKSSKKTYERTMNLPRSTSMDQGNMANRSGG